MLILTGPALVTLLVKKDVTVASCVLFIPLPLVCWWLGIPGLLVAYGVALPCLVVFMATSSALVAGFGFLVVYAIFLSMSVWSLELTTDGIRFARFLGSPKFIPWNQISTVKRVPRSELILHGWLWPPFPAREMTASLSSRDHFRIQYATGFRYFPPSDPDSFEEVVRRFAPSAT